jgi:hypothetical protein
LNVLHDMPFSVRFYAADSIIHVGTHIFTTHAACAGSTAHVIVPVLPMSIWKIPRCYQWYERRERERARRDREREKERER